MRYDRLMAFGWKFLIPFGLVWVLATGAVVVLPDVYGKRQVVIGAAILVGAVLALSLIWPLFSRPDRPGGPGGAPEGDLEREREVTSA
jgi:hypothetical protein